MCNHRNKTMHHGVYVDLFPFDEVPDDEEENIRQYQKAQKLCRLFTIRQSPDVSRPPYGAKARMIAVGRRVCHSAVKVLIPRRRLLRKLDKTFTEWNSTGQQALACLNFPKRKCEYIRKDDLFPLGSATFESMAVPVPGNTDTYLKTHYGNYLELPPEDQRFGHRPFEVQL